MKKLFLTFLIAFLILGCQKDSIDLDEQNLTTDIDISNKGPKPKVNICHKGNIINVNINAIPAHRGHGDAVDMDGDGYFDIENDCSETDCDDNEPTTYPGATEICDDGIDNDCDGDIDEGCCVPDFVQDFTTNVDGWFDFGGTITHNVDQAIVDGGAFTRFHGYTDTWTSNWTAEIDVYLDPSWAASQGFDYSVAATGSDGFHQRDYIFHVNNDASTGKLLVAGSNNTNFAPREDLESINHYEITEAGWYTFQHYFYNDVGALSVDLNLIDSEGIVLFTETLSNAGDLIPAEVGGNRYGWFTFVNVDGGINIDNTLLTHCE